MPLRAKKNSTTRSLKLDPTKFKLKNLQGNTRYHPGFNEAYPKLKEEVIQAIDPEWMATATGKH